MNTELNIAPVQPKRLLSHYHDVRRRLMSPPAAQVIKQHVEPAPKAREPKPPEPPQVRPDDGLIRRYVEATAAAYGVSYDDVLSGLPTHNIALARRLAVALAHVWGINSIAKVAKAFGVDTTTVIDAAADLSAILRQRMISTNTPFDAVLPHILIDWEHSSVRIGGPSIAEIMAVSARFFGITMNDLRSQSRSQPLARKRQIAMALSRRLTHLSLPVIGMKFGGRDHTTALHAIRIFQPVIDEVNKRIQPDASVATWLREITEEMERTPLAKWKRR